MRSDEHSAVPLGSERSHGTSLLAVPLRPLAFWPLALLAILLVVHLTCTTPILSVPQIEPDEFRFVARALEMSESHGLQRGLVENRWDQMPFVDVEGGVRFWRPLFPSSFSLDAAASNGFTDEAPSALAANGPEAWKTRHVRFAGIQRTNILLHALCCVLALLLAVRVAGTSIAAALAGLAFACFAPHAEAIWYGSGRNATLLGASFVGAFLLHTMRVDTDRRRTLRRALAPLALAAALCSKESAVVLLPLLLVHDVLWLGAARSAVSGLLARARAAIAEDRVLWTAYAAVLALFFVLRWLAMRGTDDLALVAPYVHPPWTAAFWPHALTNLGASLDALARGVPIAPFLMPSEFAARHSIAGTLLGAGLVLALVYVLRKSWHGRALLAFALLTWLPTLPVYVSQRYLYLPSFALAAAFGLAVWQLGRAGGARGRTAALGLAALIVAGAVVHARVLHRTHRYFAEQPRAAIAVSDALEGVRSGATRRFGPQRKLPRGAKVLVVDFPSDVIHAQFFEDQLRVTMNDPELEVRVLNLLPDTAQLRSEGARLVVERKARSLELRGVSRTVLEHEAERRLFPILPLSPGSTKTTRDGSVRLEVLTGDGTRAKRIRYELGEDFAEAVVLRYEAPAAHPGLVNVPASIRILNGRFVVE